MTSTKDAERLIASFCQVLEAYDPIHEGEIIQPVDAFFAFRILLGRNPDAFGELPTLLDSSLTFREFLGSLLNSEEYSRAARFLPSGHRFMTEIEDFRFWFNTGDREMGVLMALGSYESHILGLLKQLVRPGMVCIDVGGQSGFYTCLMASLVGETGKVHTFEPMPSNFEILKKNIEENGFQDRVVAHQFGASSRMASIEVSVLPNMYVVGAVHGSTTTQIDSIPVDDVVHDRVDLIKIDVEGHEPAAIEGMRSIIERSRPIIVSEVNEYWLRTLSNMSSGDYIGLLNSLGYDVYSLEDLKVPVNGELRLDTLQTIDVLAKPRVEPQRRRGRTSGKQPSKSSSS